MEQLCAESMRYRPLYEAVVQEFCRRIAIGRWPVGRALKNETLIAAEMGVSLGTVRRAFERLEAMNLVERKPGRGTVICRFDSGRRLAALTGIVDAEDQPVVGEVEIDRIEETEAMADVADALDLRYGASVVRVERRRRHEGRVFSFEVSYLNCGRPLAHIRKEALQDYASTFVLDDRFAVARTEHAQLVEADGPSAHALGLAARTRVLQLSRSLHLADGTPVEFCLAHCELGTELRYRAN